jgi:pyruvate dehydrogenase E1 component alpha subunit
MHIADFSIGILGANGIVGGGFPIIVGAGFSIKLRRTKQVGLVFFGDGAANRGTFHESLNMAAVYKLPVIFLCENNLYAATSPATQFFWQVVRLQAVPRPMAFPVMPPTVMMCSM